ncbi:MAG: 16S rRNA (uracil(1498)-N(3))-methyltransferase [Spirochaetaceae bacterium]|nr:16S rRNA (uracil(1498)-N(3))-methyltransferase [Spirochaetaceae bacterium]
MSAPAFVVGTDRLVAGTVVVDGPEGRHAATVTRLGVGETVLLTDGSGRWADGVVSGVSKDRLDVLITSVTEDPPASPRFVVVQALPKGDRGEVAVETLTEVGVDVIVPWAASRCVTRWRDDRVAKSLARWRTTGRTAAKQSRRTRFPEVTDLASTAEVAALLGAATAGVVLHEDATEPLSRMLPPAVGDLVMVVGPEGGISPDELAAFDAAGATAYRLGETVLRTSTAGTAALAVLMAGTRWR